MTYNLTQSRICIEKPLPQEEHIIKQISEYANSNHHFKKLRAAFLTQKIWPKDSKITISFSFSEHVDWTPLSVLYGLKNNDNTKVQLDPLEEHIRELSPIEAIKKVVIERLQPLVGLKFVFVDKDGNVRVGFDPNGGCYSLIGTDCINSTEPVTMNFAWLDVGTIIHEFGHVIGLIHEHQNPKGKTIPWDDSKVYEWADKTQGWDKETTYHNIIERYNINQINGSNFDKKSIMLYFFPPSLTKDHIGTSPNHKLSKEDVIYISQVYPGGILSPAEYYKNVYGESIDITNKGSKFNWKIILYILGLILILLIIFFIIRSGSNTKFKFNQSMGFSDWRKAHGGSIHNYNNTITRFT